MVQAGVYLFYLFLIQNIDCGYSLEPTINVLSQNIKSIKIFIMKFSIFTAEKILCILHGQVFVMCHGDISLTNLNLPLIQDEHVSLW